MADQLTDEDYAQLIALGSANAGLSEKLKQQRELAAQMRENSPQDRMVGQVYMPKIAAVSLGEGALNGLNRKDMAATTGQQQGNSALQNQLFLKALLQKGAQQPGTNTAPQMPQSPYPMANPYSA